MEGEQEKQDELSLTSPSFNALSALYADSVTVPYPSATTYDNIAVFESSLKKSSSKATQPSTATVKSSASDAADKREAVMGSPVVVKGPVVSTMASKRKEAILAMGIKVTGPRQPVKERKTLWGRLTAGYEHGPLSLLTRCVNDKVLVTVRTRNRREIRGCCRGYIVAFDKHMNLAMVDVDETFRNPLWLSKSGRRRLRKAQSCQLEKSIDPTVKEEDESDAGLELRTGVAVTSNKEDKTPVKNQANISQINLNTGRTQGAGGKTVTNHQVVPKELTRHVSQLFIRGDTVVTVIPVK